MLESLIFHLLEQVLWMALHTIALTCSEILFQVRFCILEICTAVFAPNTFLLLPTLLAHPLCILPHIPFDFLSSLVAMCKIT